jgi:hypothetical protein
MKKIILFIYRSGFWLSEIVLLLLARIYLSDFDFSRKLILKETN